MPVGMTMNLLVHPVFFSKVLKTYLFDKNRLQRWDETKLRRFQDKQLRNLVDRAYHTVPLYRAKYRQAGIHPKNITGVADLGKLPLISKTDINKFYPDGIIPSNKKKKRLIQISTSGTTGKKLSLYVDLYDVFVGLFAYQRALQHHGIQWRKDKLTIIGDFASHTAETGYVHHGVFSQKNFSFLFKNIQWLDTNEPPKKLMEEINKFQPDFLGGYAGMLGHLALLKEQGFGTHVSPRCVGSTGSVLDPHLRRFVAEAFDASVFEIYGSTESGPLAFECADHNLHVYSDLVLPEFLKRDGTPVDSGQPGRLVVTKLYGGGTPLIRYDAVNDIVSSTSERCGCRESGLRLLRIYGRDDLALYLSGGRVLLASSFSEIYSRILYELKTTKVVETKVIQHSESQVEVQVVFDQKSQDRGASDDEVLSLLKTGFEQKVGADVEVQVRVVKQIPKDGPRIVSFVDKAEYRIQKYI